MCLSFFCTSWVLAQNTSNNETQVSPENTGEADNEIPFKQVRYRGAAILIHLPTNAARALVMPEPVTLQDDPSLLPGVELAFEGDVVGFFATRNFSRRTVSFLGKNSGTEYQLQIRASEYGIVEPLEIVR